MHEPTQLSQPDEALRQARLDSQIRNGIDWIATRLGTFRPHDAMTANARTQAARRYADDRHPADTAQADALYAQLLRALPPTRLDDSRTVYAKGLLAGGGQ